MRASVPQRQRPCRMLQGRADGRTLDAPQPLHRKAVAIVLSDLQRLGFVAGHQQVSDRLVVQLEHAEAHCEVCLRLTRLDSLEGRTHAARQHAILAFRRCGALRRRLPPAQPRANHGMGLPAACLPKRKNGDAVAIQRALHQLLHPARAKQLLLLCAARQASIKPERLGAGARGAREQLFPVVTARQRDLHLVAVWRACHRHIFRRLMRQHRPHPHHDLNACHAVAVVATAVAAVTHVAVAPKVSTLLAGHSSCASPRPRTSAKGKRSGHLRSRPFQGASRSRVPRAARPRACGL
mmetsp:Transcript_33328/g.99241  ORF Transcript_33328/g.99241 Transcript_33328/m.99241 type:complete len:295 (-) Transcript_33328:61-945(-)